MWTIVDFLKTSDAQRGIAPTDIAAHPHGAECLAQADVVPTGSA